MRAVVIRGYDGPAGIAVADVPRPELRDPHDVIVAVKAAALNHLDLFVTRSLPGLTHDFPFVLGSDGAGVVESVGPGVTTVKPGDKVLINPGFWCGRCEYCLAGEQPLCPDYGIIGEHRPGAMAEAICLPDVNVTRLEGDVSWPEAAAFPLVGLTSWRMLVTRAALRAGETVLIQGIGGGVALASLQIARLLGARVIVTSSSDDKLARAKSLGADHGFNHGTQDVLKEVRRLTGKRGVDVVVDSIGKATWETSLRCLRRGGRLVTCGGTSGPIVETDVRKLFWYQWTILGSTMGNHAEWAAVSGLFNRGLLRPVIDQVYPMARAKDAFERMDAGGQFGKLVVEIG